MKLLGKELVLEMKVHSVYTLAQLERNGKLDHSHLSLALDNELLSLLQFTRNLYQTRQALTNYKEFERSSSSIGKDLSLVRFLLEEYEGIMASNYDEIYRRLFSAYKRAEISMKFEDANNLSKHLMEIAEPLNSLAYGREKALRLVNEALGEFSEGQGDLEDFVVSANAALEELEGAQSGKIFNDIHDLLFLQAESLSKVLRHFQSTRPIEYDALASYSWFLSPEKLLAFSNKEMVSSMFLLYNDDELLYIGLTSEIDDKFASHSIVRKAVESYPARDLMAYLVTITSPSDTVVTVKPWLLAADIKSLLFSNLRPPLLETSKGESPTYTTLLRYERIKIDFQDVGETGCPLALDFGFEIKWVSKVDGLFDCERK